MRCLSLWQPWASLCVLGLKRIESRSWRAPYPHEGTTIAIHAAKSNQGWRDLIHHSTPTDVRLHFMDALCQHFRGVSLEALASELPTGAILGTVRLKECIQVGTATPRMEPRERAFGNYAPGRWMWYLENPLAFREPIPYRGAQGLFEVPDDLVARGMQS